ncbi:RNA-binding S4 domain-containing protein [Oceanicaulis sp. LC35]|uniref:RNA-binding S4 domain-containing protein n=1 Tax=Oceanicaulis sp. LC35 TaxID=3349635 RepID=UPI003F87195D
MSEHGESMRCDVWLFRTRLYKSRGLAGQMVEKGAVRIDRNGQVTRLTKPAAPVRPGDCLVIRRDPDPMRLTILALPERRGPAPEAQSCYSLETE